MALSKNSNYYKISNAKQTVPVSANGTGTIATTGIHVKGTGTKFVAEMPAGSWLVNLTANEYHKVKSVLNDTMAELEQAFGSDIAGGTTPNIIINSKLDIRELSVIIPLGNASGEVDGVSLEAGLPVSFGKNSDNSRNNFSFIDPIIANATGTVINVIILR